MKKYKIIINIINHHLEEDELNEMFDLANKHKETPYHENFSETGGEGHLDLTANLTQLGRDLKLEMDFSGKGKTFEEKTIQMKHMIESGELQRSLLYECEADINRPGAPKKADKITATFMQIG